MRKREESEREGGRRKREEVRNRGTRNFPTQNNLCDCSTEEEAHSSSSTSPWLLGLDTIAVAIFLSKIFDLLTRPSLPLPPGPKPWLIIGNLPHMGPVLQHALTALAKTHRLVMHLWLDFVDVVVAASASIAVQFLKVHDANVSSRPPNAEAKYIAYNYPDLVFAPCGPRWRMLRKISSVHLFSGKVLDEFKHFRQVEVSRLTRNLVSAGSKAWNLDQLLNVCTINASGKMMTAAAAADLPHLTSFVETLVLVLDSAN